MGATKRRRWMTIFIVACGSVFMFLRENRVVTSDLSLLKLEPLARNSMQNRTGDFDVRPGMRSSGFISSYDRQILTQLDKTKDIWLRQDKERQAVLEKKDVHQRNHYLTKTDLAVDNLVPFSICGRETKIGSSEDIALLWRYYGQDDQYGQSQKNNTICPGGSSKNMLLLKGNGEIYGRTGNNLQSFLNALYYARDNNVQLGIMADSWVFDMLQQMWWVSIDKEDKWKEKFETAFCVKIFINPHEVEGYNLSLSKFENNWAFTKELFFYQQEISKSLYDYMAFQSIYLQTLFRNYNNGQGTTIKGDPVQDMCSGIDAVFGRKSNAAIYSVIHQRSLEHYGEHLLKSVAKQAGCHPSAALHMEPNYVKSILQPLGMLKYPVVLITDGQDLSVVMRLMNDPEIDLHLVPKNASWIGGDITLAIMSSVFIGNPASTFSTFIVKSRLALGLGHSYLFRAMNKDNEWYTVCGDTCVYEIHNCRFWNGVGHCSKPF